MPANWIKMFGITHPEIWNHIGSFLPDEDIVSFSHACRQLAITESERQMLTKRLITAGCSPDLLASIGNRAPDSDYKIENYPRLCQITEKFLQINPLMHPWQLLCLTGEPNAVDYLIKNELIRADTQTQHKQTPLHVVCFSGSVPALRVLLDAFPKLNLQAQTEEKTNIAHCAFQSGSNEMIAFVRGLRLIDFQKTDAKGWNIIHWGFWSGSYQAAWCALNLSNGINPAARTLKEGCDVLHIAAQYSSPRAIAYLRSWLMGRSLRNLASDLTRQDKEGHDVFWYASQSKRPVEVLRVLKMNSAELVKYLHPSQPVVQHASRLTL